jgi:hypothetical protein
MARLVVGNRERDVDSGLVTWGDLLGHLDRTLSESGEVVTGARFDGVEQPAFRDPSQAPTLLSTLALVEVQACSPAELLGRTLAEARAAMPELRAVCRTLADQFRGHDVQRANQGLLEFSESVAALVAIFQTVSQALHASLESVTLGTRDGRSVLVDLGRHLSALVSAQEILDWLTVADVLEYDIEPVMGELGELLAALSRIKPN